LSCSGQRDRTKFINLSAYSENSLVNDYHFLEDVLQYKDKSKRTFAATGKKGAEIIIASSDLGDEGNHNRNKKTADSVGTSIAWPEISLPTSTITGVPLPLYNKQLKKLVQRVLERGTRMVY
jgi:hypothetical protein